MMTDLEIIYENNLDTHKLARIFNNKSQSYKFYWFEALLNLAKNTEEDLFFEDIINEMICEAWHTVTHFHLRLGPTVNGNAENFLERAINTLNSSIPDLPVNPSREVLLSAINSCNEQLMVDKYHLADYVPYKLLYPFFDDKGLEDGLNYIKKDQHRRLIAYMTRFTDNDKLLYIIIDGVGLKKRIRLNPYWRRLLLENYSVIQSWVRYHKVQFLQDKNPGVPGIMYKIYPENENERKLQQARDLWKTTEELTGCPVKEIYTGLDIPANMLSLDHFIPRSYISNDELWNLIPMRKNFNSSKNNQLPDWDLFFSSFANYQYYLYCLIFPPLSSQQSNVLRDKFEKCRKNNINAIWATENLYISGNSKEQFLNILYRNYKPVYDAAKLQGYKIWNYTGKVQDV